MLELTIAFNEQHESRRVGIAKRMEKKWNEMKNHPLGMNPIHQANQPTSQPGKAKSQDKKTNHNTKNAEEKEKKNKKKQAPSFTHKLFPMLQQVYFHSLHRHYRRYHPSQASLPPVPYAVDSEGGPRNCPRSYPGRAYIAFRGNRGTGYGADIGISIYARMGCWK